MPLCAIMCTFVAMQLQVLPMQDNIRDQLKTRWQQLYLLYMYWYSQQYLIEKYVDVVAFKSTCIGCPILQ